MGYNTNLLYNNKIIVKDNKNLRVSLERNIGNGLTFDGVNDVVFINSSSSLDITSSSFSASFIVKPNTTAGVHNICTKGFGNVRVFGAIIVGNNLQLSFGDGVNSFGTFYYNVLIPFSYTTTVHVIFIKPDNDANNAVVLVNDVVVPHTILDNNLTTIFTNAHRTQIGDFPDGYFSGIAPFNGIIYDIKLFNTAITLTEASQLYNTRAEVIPSTIISNCVLNTRFNEKENFTAYDTSGNSNNGTLTNYTLGDVTLGVTNKWVDEFGNPILI